MKFQWTRRQLIESIGFAALPFSLTPAVGANRLEGDIKLSMPGRDLSDSTLSFIRQMGVKWITMGGPGAPTYSPEASDPPAG
jgi:hypothetical protein